MYYANPSTYWIGGMLAATLDGIQVRCAPTETALFNPPPGNSCQSYMDAFPQVSGYLVNGKATSNCEYCPYKTGNEYLSTLNIQADEKWRDFGIFFAFCISNWALVYFFIYTVRILGWSFGFGRVFGGLANLVRLVKKQFRRQEKEQREQKDKEHCEY